MEEGLWKAHLPAQSTRRLHSLDGAEERMTTLAWEACPLCVLS